MRSATHPNENAPTAAITFIAMNITATSSAVNPMVSVA